MRDTQGPGHGGGSRKICTPPRWPWNWESHQAGIWHPNGRGQRPLAHGAHVYHAGPRKPMVTRQHRPTRPALFLSGHLQVTHAAKWASEKSQWPLGASCHSLTQHDVSPSLPHEPTGALMASRMQLQFQDTRSEDVSHGWWSGAGLGLSAAGGAAPGPTRSPLTADSLDWDWGNGTGMGEGTNPETPDPRAPVQEVGTSPKCGPSTPATARAQELGGPRPSLQPRHPQASRQEGGHPRLCPDPTGQGFPGSGVSGHLLHLGQGNRVTQ